MVPKASRSASIVSVKGCVFVDSHCSREACPQLRRASWAVVNCEEAWPHRLLSAVFGPVWAGLPQTPAAAEHVAYNAATQFLEATTEMVIDCSAVIMHAQLPWPEKSKGSKMYAAIMADAGKKEGAAHIEAHTKVKSHQCDDDFAPGTRQRQLVHGNAQADKHAAEATEQHLQQDHSVRNEVVDNYRCAATVFALMVAILPLFPNNPVDLARETGETMRRQRSKRKRTTGNGRKAGGDARSVGRLRVAAKPPCRSSVARACRT